MQMPQLKNYRVNLHILSSIHVGTGEELDPFSYVIKEGVLFLINLVDWMEAYAEKDMLYKIMNSENFARTRSFVAENFDLKDAVLCGIPIDNQKLIDTYNKGISEKDPTNQVLIDPMPRNNVTKGAYIPGSSIKGAIRTAVANRFVKKAGVTSEDDRGRPDYNQKIFGKIGEDPMRWLKLSDVSLGESGTVIVEAKEYPLNPNKPLTPKGHMEVAFSLCHIGKPFIYPLRFSLAPFSLHGTKVDLRFILESLYQFYVSKYQEEYEKFFRSKSPKEVRAGMILLNKAIAELRTNETLIRIGHFSHVECITLDGVRNPKTKKGRDGRPLPWGTTRTLANGVYPFGWAKLEFPDLESNPRPSRDWPFKEDMALGTEELQPGKIGAEYERKASLIEMSSLALNRLFEIKAPAKPAKKDATIPEESLSLLEKIKMELDLVKSTDMGRIGTIIQKIDSLETETEKAEIAKAIRDKIGKKAFKKHKQREYLAELIGKVK